MVIPTVEYMLSDDFSADVVEIDFEAIYHGDVLVEGDTSEQFDDWHPLRTAVLRFAGNVRRASLPKAGVTPGCPARPRSQSG